MIARATLNHDRPRLVTLSLAAFALCACKKSAGNVDLAPEASQQVAAAELKLAPPPAPGAATPAPAVADAAAPPVLTVSDLEPEIPPDACPATMRHIPGGEFWMGSPRGKGAREERPRFSTRVANFCMDATEVNVASYRRCVEQGHCTVPHGTQSTCNYGKRDDHPVNCVDWEQAKTYCEAQGARLPSELEWEYAARGGALQLAFPWGDEKPDGRTCWKASLSCPVASFSPGVFDLHDMSGNVWEWTNDWFGDYPWPERDGRSKVYRGGSWSRRFDKWLSPTLRNRSDPKAWGSHLGFRCATLPKYGECPFGPGTEPGTCRHGVVDAECADPKQSFNGWRCAPPNSPDCRASHEALPGYGCVPTNTPRPSGDPERERNAARENDDAESAPVTRSRSPEFDADCRTNQPKRPNAYKLEGGTHAGRNSEGRKHGCKNRDVGVGWNSACCP